MRTKKPITHGTRSGYLLELSRKVKPCDECRKANSAYKAKTRIKSILGPISINNWPSPGWWQVMLGLDFMDQLTSEAEQFSETEGSTGGAAGSYKPRNSRLECR